MLVSPLSDEASLVLLVSSYFKYAVMDPLLNDCPVIDNTPREYTKRAMVACSSWGFLAPWLGGAEDPMALIPYPLSIGKSDDKKKKPPPRQSSQVLSPNHSSRHS
jgi:hypothetical protein